VCVCVFVCVCIVCVWIKERRNLTAVSFLLVNVSLNTGSIHAKVKFLTGDHTHSLFIRLFIHKTTDICSHRRSRELSLTSRRVCLLWKN
jgi:hypothetical protein